MLVICSWCDLRNLYQFYVVDDGLKNNLKLTMSWVGLVYLCGSSALPVYAHCQSSAGNKQSHTGDSPCVLQLYTLYTKGLRGGGYFLVITF